MSKPWSRRSRRTSRKSAQTKCGSMKRSCSDGAPAGELAGDGGVPEPGDQGADQQLLGERHPRVGGHLEAAELDEAEAAGGAVGGVELVDADLGAVGVAGDVDEQVAQQAVDQPRGGGVAGAGGRHLGERDLELVERVVAGLVDARGLGGRADEEAGEEIGDRRVALPVQDEAAQQVGAAQERAVEGGGAADDDVVAAAGAGVLAVDHELVGAEPALAGLLVDRGGDRDAVVPGVGGVDVDLDDPGVGGDADDVQARVGRRAHSPRCGWGGPSPSRPPRRRRSGRDSPRRSRPAA